MQFRYFEGKILQKPILLFPFPDDQEISKNAKSQTSREPLTTALLSMFSKHAFCWGCPLQTRRGQDQRQSQLTDTSHPQIPLIHSCHPQPDHSLQMLLLIMKELSCSLYPTTLWFSIGGYPEKIWWTNPYRKPKSTPEALSFTLRCKGLKQWFISTSTEKYLLRKESSGAKGSLQLQLAFAHDVSAGTICHSSFWWIVYSWVLSS